ncbi:hypothetical protein CBR_g49141 [Chara braunii]|uniref:Reverse transcriptase/retrotransposon-derived protein RNase H-like domain-containing protein n=1 Tax=Chara braunii TaxID=69332 RepID=A0A388K4X8_CHABU|nr:hypothetical protein CBR_g49141 [Chara braunii]|eukprot:GBG65069.1 hypothetical protein CBR_g49141 [Chara braunii]
MQRRAADIEEQETMDLANMDDDVRVVRKAMLGVIEMQEHQTTILQDIQQSLAILVGRSQVAPSPPGPGAWLVAYPPFSVPPVTGVSPYVAPSSVAIVSLGMPLSGGVTAGSSLQVFVKTVFTQNSSQVAVTTQHAVSPVPPQGTQPQQLSQQPVSPGPQPGVVQGPGQTQWVPKTAIAAPKLFTGDKRGEDLNAWLRAVSVYVRCKLTLPHEEVLVAASCLKGSAARWLSGLVQLQGYGHDFRTWAATQKLDDFLKMVEERWHDPQEAQSATDAIMTLHTRQFKSVREATDAVERLICLPGVRYDPQWTDECEVAFRHVKHALTHYEVLKLPDPDKPFIVTTDASQYGIGAVFAQQEGPKLRPVEYLSKKMSSHKLAKSTYEKELYAVYKALTHWRHFLLGRFFILRTDHQTLRWMRTQPVLSDALKRWIEVIEQYDFDPQYLKGEYNKVADALSCRPDFSSALVTEFDLADNVTQSMVEAYREDQFMSEIIRRLQAKDKRTSAEFELVKGLLFLEKAGNKSLVRICTWTSWIRWSPARMKREKKRREEVNRLTAEVEKVRACRQEVQAQANVSSKMDKMLGYLEVLSEAWLEECQANWGHDVALNAMRSGFREFARDMVTHVGAEVRRLKDNVGKLCEGAIEGAKAIATVEGEAKPRTEPVKLKFPDAYIGKPKENFDNWEASVNNYVYLQHIVQDDQVLVAFQALKEEAASFARSLARAAGCENNMVAYSKVTPLPQFFKLLRERFADLRGGVRASDKLQTIHSRQWRSARALKAVMDDLVAVPDHGVTESQLVQLFYRAMPEPLRGHFFDKSQQPTMMYDALNREVVLFEAKSMPVSTFWHKDLDKGKKWKGRTISGQVRAKDHMILTLEEGGIDEVPYSQIEWGLEKEDSSVGQGRSYAAVAAEWRPQGRGGGQGQRGQAMGGRGSGAQGVGGPGNRQAGGRGQGPPPNRQGPSRSPQRRGGRSPQRSGGWHPG